MWVLYSCLNLFQGAILATSTLTQTWKTRMICLNTNLQPDSGLNGKWKGGNVSLMLEFNIICCIVWISLETCENWQFETQNTRFICLKLFVASVSACQWQGLHTEPQFIMISCGYLLVMMEMPGMLLLLYFVTVDTIFTHRTDIVSPCTGWMTCGPLICRIESMHVGRRPV